MKETSLYKFITEYIDDSYAMSVLYTCMQKIVADCIENQEENKSIDIDGRYLGEAITIKLLLRGEVIENWLSLLLSVRIILLNHKTFELCEDDRLLFYPRPIDNFEWVSYFAIINEHLYDEEVQLIYSMFERVCTKGRISKKDCEDFIKLIKIPEFKNEELYYRNLASTSNAVNDTIIGNRAFVESEFEDYTVDRNILYIGDTAFAFCPNLRTIVFEGKTLLGKFPIIECPKLSNIIVPEEYYGYYKSVLPYYDNIISCNSEGKALEEAKLIDVEETTTEKFIDFKLLDKVFEKKASSYKYLWMIAILSLAKEKNSLSISYRDMTIRMASFAWPLIFEDDLDFGSSDRMKAYLIDVQKRTTLIPAATQNVVERYLNQHFESQGLDKILSPLLKNVPYRFLSPWIKFTTVEEVVDISNSKFYTGPYALHEEGILFDEDWWDYINDNHDKIYAFTITSFLDYLKSYNQPLKLLKLNLLKH